MKLEKISYFCEIENSLKNLVNISTHTKKKQIVSGNDHQLGGGGGLFYK